MTPEHPFNVVNEGWVEAGKLSVGTVIHSLDGQAIRVQSVEQEAQRQDTYNFEVADYHTYFVGQNGVWVHNVCGNVPKSTKNLTISQKRSINSLTKRIDEHKKKLEDFKKNPNAFDNKGFLKNVPSDEIRQRIIDGQVRHLEKEIEDFQKGIDDILGG